MSGGTIFGLRPFTPKRVLILPSEGGEITLYVVDGKAYTVKHQEVGMWPRREIHTVHFEGWSPSFTHSTFDIPVEHLVDNGGDTEHYNLEVVFRLVPSDKVGQTAEIVAVSYDGGETFLENELCELPKEYEELSTALAS